MESEGEDYGFERNVWDDDDYGTLKMSMAELKQFITKSMVEVCITRS